ncbi:protein FAR1-RELATED SEQUENCE 12-like [Rhododendron vialii]|uniref:protein FAR1-RELATED SEQUENCE 12-like n=1 Tax=Rhododendron vialii TaxID=182163 RepID=UPI0026604EEB|nr:protein FAR1-RELATED SEQUENCE 12-like [Rhododendron vialii]
MPQPPPPLIGDHVDSPPPTSFLLENSSQISTPTRMEDGGQEKNVKQNEEFFKDYTPCVGMEFESEKATFEFYNNYAGIIGFSVRNRYGIKSRTDGVWISRKFVWE